MHINDLQNLINLRGMREQAFQFSTGKFHGGMKQCKTKGCEIFVPLYHALKGSDLEGAIFFDMVHNGEFRK